MYTYRQILKQALKTAWHNPGLWFFGFFVILLGNIGELDLIISSYGFGRDNILLSFWQGLADGGLFSSAGISGTIKIFFTSPVYLFAIALFSLIILGLSVLVIWLVMVSQSALIGQVINISKNRKLSWRESFGLGLNKFWPVLGLNFLMRFAIWFLFTLSGLLAFFSFPADFIIFIPTFVIFLILIIGISFTSKYAICGVILKDWKFTSSIQSGFGVFKRNWLLSLEIALILLGVYLFANVFLLFFLSLILVLALKIYGGFWFGLILILFILAVIFIVAQTLLSIFHWATWVIVFELISNKKNLVASLTGSVFKSLAS